MAFGQYVPVPDSLDWLQSKSFLWTEQSSGFRIVVGDFCLFLCLFLRGKKVCNINVSIEETD